MRTEGKRPTRPAPCYAGSAWSRSTQDSCLVPLRTAMVQDTGEYLLGSSAVTVAFMESTGAASTEDWNSESIANVKAKIEEALLWWQDTLANKSSVHRISFTTDYQYADNPVPTTVEPIAEKNNVYTTWVNDFLDHVAANTSDGISADLRKFNDSQRQQHGTDWGFTIFVVNDENDLDGMFAEGGHFAEHLHSRADATWLSPLVARPRRLHMNLAICSGPETNTPEVDLYRSTRILRRPKHECL